MSSQLVPFVKPSSRKPAARCSRRGREFAHNCRSFDSLDMPLVFKAATSGL